MNHSAADRFLSFIGQRRTSAAHFMSLRRDATSVRLLMRLTGIASGLDQVIDALAIDAEHAADGFGAPHEIVGECECRADALLGDVLRNRHGRESRFGSFASNLTNLINCARGDGKACCHRG